MHRSLLSAFILTCGLALPAFTEDRGEWLQFRGTIGDGVTRVTDLPTSWSDTENINWRCELPGEGWSSPVVDGNRIYLTSAIQTESGERELALLIVDAQAGKLLERIKVFTQPSTAPKIHSKNSHASPTPIVAGDRIYLHFGHQGTACLRKNGEIVWRNDKLTYPPVHGNGGSPVLVGKALIFSQDGGTSGKVIALNADTGDVLWETDRNVEATKKFSFCTPLVLERNGQSKSSCPAATWCKLSMLRQVKKFGACAMKVIALFPSPSWPVA